jgi:hypothetical protein
MQNGPLHVSNAFPTSAQSIFAILLAVIFPWSCQYALAAGAMITMYSTFLLIRLSLWS